MSMDELKQKAFLWKYSLVKPNAISYYHELLRHQTLPPDELEELSWRRTRSLLAYAFQRVPYYRRRFDELGLSPQDIVHPEDYAKVPILTREDLREHFEELVSADAKPRNLRISTTGGSTGEPVKVYHEKRVVRMAAAWRMLSWWGLHPGVDYGSVYRDTRTDWRGRIVNAVMFWPVRRLILNAVALTPGEMERFIHDLNTVKPPLLHGYVGAIDHLASFIEERGLRVAPPRAIWVTAAPITSVQEKRIERAFGGPVYDQYGSCEIYWLAAQCPAKGPLHTFGDIRRIEFLNAENRPCPSGELGKIVVTDLENRLFPIIRYLNGDMGRAIPGICSCGITLPLMDKVAGRVTDMVRMPNGTCISGDYLTTIFDGAPDAVKQFRVHQRADYSLEVLVVPNLQFPNLDTLLAGVREGLLTRAEGQVAIEIHKVENIQQKGGKLRFVSSDVK